MKHLITFLTFALFSFSAFSQDFQISPFAGYQLGGKLKLIDNEVKFANGVNFGVRLSRGFQGRNLEVSYTHFLTEAILRDFAENEIEREKASMGYIEVGLVQDIQVGNSDVVPFINVTTGGSYIKVNTISGNIWSFTLGLGAGMKYFFSDAVGIRVQARFLLPMYFNGYCGWGYCYYDYRAVPQGEFSGGLVFRVGG